MDGQNKDTNANDVIIFEESTTLSPAEVSLKNLDLELTSKFETSSSAPAPGAESKYYLLQIISPLKAVTWF